jgi:hypothetical protein
LVSLVSAINYQLVGKRSDPQSATDRQSKKIVVIGSKVFFERVHKVLGSAWIQSDRKSGQGDCRVRIDCLTDGKIGLVQARALNVLKYRRGSLTLLSAFAGTIDDQLQDITKLLSFRDCGFFGTLGKPYTYD